MCGTPIYGIPNWQDTKKKFQESCGWIGRSLVISCAAIGLAKISSDTIGKIFASDPKQASTISSAWFSRFMLGIVPMFSVIIAKQEEYSEIDNAVQEAMTFIPKEKMGEEVKKLALDVMPEELAERAAFIKIPKKDLIFKNVDRDNGIIFHGISGGGKTVLAKIFTHKVEGNFIHIDTAILFNKWFGQSSKIASKLFEEIKKTAQAQQETPFIVFVDEADGVFAQRDKAGGHSTSGEQSRVVNALLEKLQSLRGTNVHVIAATNHRDALDKAGKRRFPLDIMIGLPKLNTRKAVWQKLFDNNNINNEALLNYLARNTNGMAISDIDFVFQELTSFCEIYSDNRVPLDSFDPFNKNDILAQKLGTIIEKQKAECSSRMDTATRKKLLSKTPFKSIPLDNRYVKWGQKPNPKERIKERSVSFGDLPKMVNQKHVVNRQPCIELDLD